MSRIFKFNNHQNYNKVLVINSDIFAHYIQKYSDFFYGQILLYTYYFDQYIQKDPNEIDFKRFRQNMYYSVSPATPLKICTQDGNEILIKPSKFMYEKTILYLCESLCEHGLLVKKEPTPPNHDFIISPEYENNYLEKFCDTSLDYRRILKLIGPKEMALICKELSSNLMTISKCFSMKKDTTLFRVLFFKTFDPKKYEPYSILSRMLSTSLEFSDCLVTFGLNKYLKTENDGNMELSSLGLVIERIRVTIDTNVIPTSLCSLQDESELILMPGLRMDKISDRIATIDDMQEYKKGFKEGDIFYNKMILNWYRALDAMFPRIRVIDYNTY